MHILPFCTSLFRLAISAPLKFDSHEPSAILTFGLNLEKVAGMGVAPLDIKIDFVLSFLEIGMVLFELPRFWISLKSDLTSVLTVHLDFDLSEVRS